MTASLAELLARGQAWADQGEFVDALLFFRQAMLVAPGAPAPRWRLGEALWQLDRRSDALQVWREAAAGAPEALELQSALAEGLLLVGDRDAARVAAAQVLRLQPERSRALAVAGIAALGADAAPGLATGAAEPEARLLELLQREPALFGATSLMGALASSLAASAPREGGQDFRPALAAEVVSRAVAADLPPLLLAMLVESVGDDPALLEVLASGLPARVSGRAEIDALRRVARAVRRPLPALGATLVRRYAELCAAMSKGPPLLWPLRSAGGRLRVVVLLPSEVDAVGVSTATALYQLSDATFEAAFAQVGATPTSPPGFAVPGQVPVLALPLQPDEAAARRVASFDADVLVDLCGLNDAVGPLLASRPGRTVVTVATLGAPAVPPQVDHVLADEDALVEWIRAAQRSVAELPASRADRHELHRVWDEGVRAHSRQDRRTAMNAYARFLDLQPGYAQAAYLLGLCRRDEGDFEGAAAALSMALRGAPRFADARVAAARNEIARGRPEAAVELCAAGVAVDERDPALWRGLGSAQLARGDGPAAAQAFERARALAPTDADTNYNLGVALQMQRAFQDAGRAYQRALLFAPDMFSAHYNLGVLFQQQDSLDNAIAAYRRSLAIEPRHPGANRSLGEALLLANRVDEFCAQFQAFEASHPDSLSVATQALAACQLGADFGRLQHYLDGLRVGKFRAGDRRELLDCLEDLLYQLLFFDIDPETMLAQYRTYDAVAREVYGAPVLLSQARRPGRLRLGYLSADLRDHVMGKMMLAALEHHDRDRFEVYFYSLSDVEDAWTDRFRAAGDRLDRIGHLSERDAALHIARDDLDLLVDLGAHTRGAKPGILVCKPARVQITHVASAGAVGSRAIDFKLADRLTDLPESGAFLLERLLPMDGCVYPYRVLPAVPRDPGARHAAGIPGNAVVIGAFVTPMKLSQRCLVLWRDVLARLPRALLLFSPQTPSLQPAYRRLMAAAGITADRFGFLPPGRDEAAGMARYAVVDIVLDPLPFGGVNGVLEPLCAGVPVVTLVGRRHGERSAYSILSHLGVTQTIAHSGREYVDIAVRLTEDAGFAAAVRTAMRAGLAQSPLTDMPAHTRALERAYVSALEQHYPAALEGRRDG